MASLGSLVGMLSQSVVAQVAQPKVYFYITDHLGTPQKVVDSAGAVVWSGDYRPFGEVSSGVSTVQNAFRFPGQYFELETGLHYNYHRYYGPRVGRYLQTDPIGLNGGINLFTYVGNNPVVLGDPLGLLAWADPIQYWHGFGTGGYAFWRNYSNMRNANTIGADKYFHCMANCEASRKGLGGKDVAAMISEGRELFDEYIKGDPRSACDQDRAANQQGTFGDPNRSCRDACKSLRPSGLPPQY